MSAVCWMPGHPPASRTTIRTGRYVPGLTQMVSDTGLFRPLVSSIASTPSTRCRPATDRIPQETAERTAPATVAGTAAAGRPIPGNPKRKSRGTPTGTGPQPCTAALG